MDNIVQSGNQVRRAKLDTQFHLRRMGHELAELEKEQAQLRDSLCGALLKGL